MKRIFCITALLLLLVSASCSAPAGGDAGSATPAAPAPTTARDAIAAAPADELRSLISQFKDGENWELLYAAALRLTELDPSDADAYIIAADALLRMSAANIDEVNRLLALGAGNAENTKALAAWAEQNQPDFSVIIPFAPDYATADEINKDGVTPGNQTNAGKYSGNWHGGLVTWQGDWAYLSRPDEEFAVYKMRADGNDYQRIGEARGCSLNVIGDWLYFINTSDNDTPWRVRTDGSMMEKLSDDGCAFLSVEGDYMYYDNGSDDGCLYKVKIGNDERLKLSDGTVMFTCVADGWVYYCEKSMNGGFYRVSVDGGEKRALASGFIQTYCVADGWVYYFDVNDPRGVLRVRTDGTGNEMFFPFNDRIATINVTNGTLVIGFGVSHEEDGFFITEEAVMIDIATKNKVGHVEVNTEAICVGPGGSLYFGKYDEGLAWYKLMPDEALSKVG